MSLDQQRLRRFDAPAQVFEALADEVTAGKRLWLSNKSEKLCSARDTVDGLTYL